MAYRLPGKRVGLDLDGPSVEVEPIRAWAIQRLGLARYQAFEDAKTPDAELAALIELYRLVVSEGQPTWDILDHHGPVPAHESGMLRLPLPLGLAIAEGWLRTLTTEAEPETAVDAIVPPGPVRNELKRRLRKAA